MKTDLLNTMFDIEAGEEHARFRHAGLLSVLLGFGNLLLCARAAPAGPGVAAGPLLHTLLFLELSALAFLHAFYHIGVSARVTSGTEVLPVPAVTRRLFALLGPLRRPFTCAVAAPAALFLAVSFRRAPGLVLIAPLAVLLAAAAVSVWTGAVLSFTHRSGPGVVAAALVLGVPAMAFTAMLFDTPSVLAAFPPVGLSAAAVEAALRGDHTRSALFLLALAVLAAAPFLLRRRA